MDTHDLWGDPSCALCECVITDSTDVRLWGGERICEECEEELVRGRTAEK
jgi:hypothetical protein